MEKHRRRALSSAERAFWQTRYDQQAEWTSEVRRYLLDTAGIRKNARILEIGCAGGVILEDLRLKGFQNIFGLDIDHSSLRKNAAQITLLCADGLELPFAGEEFDFVFCHFLLLWIEDIQGLLMEANRVLKTAGYFAAFAEPDYSNRRDYPPELGEYGFLQNQALLKRGARLDSGSRLKAWLKDADFDIVLEGIIDDASFPTEMGMEQSELAVLEDDLHHVLQGEDLKKAISKARTITTDPGTRLHVPTHFALARKTLGMMV